MILNFNELIEIQLLPGIESTDSLALVDPFCTYFTAEMTPMCASVLDVRRLVGAFVTEIPDDVINQLILEWSITAQDLASCSIDDVWKRYAGKWVAYKTALTIIYNTEDFRGATSDKEFKQLGDFSISKGGASTSGGGVTKLADWLECEAFKYEFSVRNCTPPTMNCLGLTDNSAVPYMADAAQLVDRGVNTYNKPTIGRRWVTNYKGHPRGNNTLYHQKRKYRTNLGAY